MTHADDWSLVHAILAREVPEVASGTIELRRIAREPGRRTKLAVASLSPELDPVVTCVGSKASRINAVVAALGGERIDVLPWSDVPERFVKLALAPARIGAIDFDLVGHRAVVHVSPDQLDLARGDDDLNSKLASELTGWTVAVVADGAG
jgi:N utilization substance protein A